MLLKSHNVLNWTSTKPFWKEICYAKVHVHQADWKMALSMKSCRVAEQNCKQTLWSCHWLKQQLHFSALLPLTACFTNVSQQENFGYPPGPQTRILITNIKWFNRNKFWPSLPFIPYKRLPFCPKGGVRAKWLWMM